MIKQKVLLKNYSNYKIGGPAEYFLEAQNLNELKDGIFEWFSICKENNLDKNKLFILGEGTNILFSDEGFSGLIIHNTIDFIETIANDQLEIGAGTSIEKINQYCVDTGLSGLEWSGGLPGSLGGAIFGNAGAFDGETKDNIISVKSLRLQDGNIIERNNKECQFNYRSSIFKDNIENKEIIISAVLQMKKYDNKKIAESVNNNIAYRQEHQPLDLPSAGSVFKNIDLKLCSEKLIKECKAEIKSDPFPVIPVAYLIYKAGLIGKTVGDAQISSKHPNFIVNLGRAKARDIVDLVQLVKNKLNQLYQIEVESEIRIMQ